MQQILRFRGYAQVDSITVGRVDGAVYEENAVFIKLPGLLCAEIKQSAQALKIVHLKR